MAEIVDAVRDSNVEVYLDGGIRKGTDVLKALALGAQAVFVGRPPLWGLAYDVCSNFVFLNYNCPASDQNKMHKKSKKKPEN